MTRIGYAVGTFDLFHIGHLTLLKHAREQCDRLVVGVASDELLELTKGRRPIIPLGERLDIVRALAFVDEVRAETSVTGPATWREVGFDIFFTCADWRSPASGRALHREFAELGVEVAHLSWPIHTASTQLRRALDALAAAERPALTA